MSRILLIEDNPDQAFVASRFLERAGFAVAHELTGAAGNERLIWVVFNQQNS